MDNRFIERLWRSLKYEDIYLRGYEHGLELRRGVGNWFGDYNEAWAYTRRWATPRPQKCIAHLNRMAQDLQVGLEIRPPMAVEKNHSKKTGERKSGAAASLSPFPIS